MKTSVTVTAPVVKLCPFKDEVDCGTVTLTFHGDALELHGLAAVLASFRDTRISHEDFGRRLLERGADRVVSTWTTAGLAVEVTTERSR